jgi:hypothetical protein
MHTRFQTGSLKGTNHLEGLDLDRTIKVAFKEGEC